MLALRVGHDRLELERERLWANVWLCAGRASDAATPGSYFTFELAREMMLVINDAGTLRAFHNVCQHRGHPLRPCGRGNVGSLVCPYHGWTYSLGGRLEHVPDRHSFPGQVAADEFSLRALGCEQAAGFVWVHFGEVRESLSAFLADVGPALEKYGMADWGSSQAATLELSTSWQAALDAQQASNGAQGNYRVSPNLQLAVWTDHALIHRYRPHPEDPQRSFLDSWRLRRDSAG